MERSVNMAAKSTKLASSLVVKIKTGVNSKTGKDVNKNITLGNLVVTAADQDVYDVAMGIGKVLPFGITEIDRVDHNDVTNA